MNKLIQTLGILILGAILLVGCGNGKETNAGDEANNEQGSTDQASESRDPNIKDFYKIGEVLSLEGMEFTVTSAKYTEPTQNAYAQSGKVLTILLSIKNTNSESAFADNTEFVLAGGSGTEYVSYYGYTDANLFTADLEKGAQMECKLAFDVADEDEYIISYTPSFTSNDVGIIKFKIAKADIQ